MKKNTAFVKVCNLAGTAIKKYAMIDPDDRLLVGVSGGLDSMLLMHVLAHLQRHAPIHFHLQAVTVDMGFETFDSRPVHQYCLDQGWQHRIVHFPGARLLQEKAAEDRPCALCSRLRRGCLHAAAGDLNCNKLVLGQHLDDLCVSLLMSLFRGGGLKTMGPHVAADSGRKQLIRPLCLAPKALLVRAAAEFNLPEAPDCPYKEQLKAEGDRAYLETLLTRLEVKFPAIRQTMLHSMGDLRPEHLLDPRFLDLAFDNSPGNPPCEP
jgi:tRNA 2-thiocytidine biosynthesis protein TtcA